MSDAEGEKKSGYRLEYAPSRQSKCSGPKPCTGTKIEKGALRMGSLIDFKGNTTFKWRHWGCVTPTIIKNMKNSFPDADDLDGFEDLQAEDQERVRTAYEEGKVADEDIPETARKPADENGDEEDEEKPKKKKAGKASKKDKDADGPPKKDVFKLEYASSGRAKCKVCGENVGKNFFRLGNEIDFRGGKAFNWRHWGCTDDKLLASLKASYDDPAEVEGFGELKSVDQDKVRRALEEGGIPDGDKGVGEAVDTGKKAPVRRKKKDAEDGDEEKPKKKARKPKAKKEEDDDDEDDEEPKKRAPAKASPKYKPQARARAPRKQASEDEASGEEFGDEDEDEEEEESSKKRKRAPSKASASKPPSKRARPASTRTKKKQEPVYDDSELEDDDE